MIDKSMKQDEIVILFGTYCNGLQVQKVVRVKHKGKKQRKTEKAFNDLMFKQLKQSLK